MKSDLRQIATEARERAYAPYSKFSVGAALQGQSGSVFSGCNIENVSLGLTLCAERVAVGKAIEASERHFQCLVIVADTETPVVPCGACRQVLAEFSPALRIQTWTLAGKNQEFCLADLLPLPAQGILEVPRRT